MGHPALLWPLPHSSYHRPPFRVLGHCQPCIFCPAWGPIICVLTHLPFSRCDLFGEGPGVLEAGMCVARCNEESGLARVGSAVG